MVKIERCPIAPASLAVEKTKKNGSYKNQDVIDQLYADFHGKCYICESDELTAPEVEHLLPHHNGEYPDRKFDWNNLFLSCRHCNSIKNRPAYEQHIIDCCRIDPEALLHQEYVFDDGHVSIKPLDETAEAQTTAKLIEDCFELTVPPLRGRVQSVMAKKLKNHMLMVQAKLDECQKTQSPDALNALRGMLNRSYKFAGFTRTYVRQYLTTYPELAPLIAL